MKLHGMKFFYGKVDIGLMQKIYCKKIPTGDMALKQQRKNLEKVTRSDSATATNAKRHRYHSAASAF